jgi:hypothetical protein
VKIGIVIPLKSKKVAKNWDATSRNLQATVNSVLAQNSNDYSAVVVGHDRPDFFKDDYYKNSKCKFIHYKDFAPPKVGQNEAENQLKYEFDRCTKILRGVMHLKENIPFTSHWFALDADDLIHDKFVTFLSAYNNVGAIILEKGYFYFKNTGIINEENEFSAYCGSSAIISDRYFNLPDVVDEKSYRKTPFGRISHVHMKQRMLNDGVSVSVPDERLIMYVRDNGENISNDAYCNTFYKKLKKFIKMFLKLRFVGRDVRAHFGLEKEIL